MGTVRMDPPPPIRPSDNPMIIAPMYPMISKSMAVKGKVLVKQSAKVVYPDGRFLRLWLHNGNESLLDI
jgi:hypothetical protein